MNHSKLEAAIFFLGFLWISMIGLSRGSKILRQGRLEEHSGEYIHWLNRVNILDALRRRPGRERLTDRQIRMVGYVDLIGGLLALAWAAYALYSLLS